MDKLVSPKLVLMILDEFDKGDKQAPRVRSVYYQPLQQHSEKEIKIYIVNKRERD